MRRVQAVEIRNIKGVADAEFPVGSLTILRGDNGTGKTSILDAIASVFEGGHDPSLIRTGADGGTVTIHLSDGVTIEKLITPNRSTLEVRTSDGSIVPKPAAFVERLATGFAFDPLAFLGADKKKRAQYLIEAMPVTFQPEEVEAAGGGRPANVLNIETFDNYRAGVYERRRQANVLSRQLDGAYETARKSMPENDGIDHTAKAAGLREYLGTLRSKVGDVSISVKAQADTHRAEAKAEYEKKLAEIERAEAQLIAEESSALRAEIETVKHDLGKEDELAKQQQRAAGSKVEIDRLAKDVREQNMLALKLGEAIDALDELKQKKLAGCEIPGLEVRDGDIFAGGVPLDQLNTQSQYFVAFQVAALRRGELGFMVCDRVESIVGEQWDQFQAAAKDSGFQVIVARSEPEPLAVVSDGELFPVSSGGVATAKAGRARRGKGVSNYPD